MKDEQQRMNDEPLNRSKEQRNGPLLLGTRHNVYMLDTFAKWLECNRTMVRTTLRTTW